MTRPSGSTTMHCSSVSRLSSNASRSSNAVAKKLLASREIAQKGGLPFMITEYKDGLQGGPGCAYGGKHGDMAYAAAFIIHVRAAAPLRLLPKSQTSHCADNSDANRARRLLLVDDQ